MKPVYLIVPGLSNSGELHWQSLWEQKYSNYYRLEQKQWIQPIANDWIETIDNYVAQFIGKQIIIIAHSMGCIAVAMWARKTKHQIAGAFFVAPPDIEYIEKNKLAIGFSIPKISLPFESTLVASTNDKYADIKVSQQYASYWNSRFINIGNKGHINADSGFGEWYEGQILLNEFVESHLLVENN